MLTKEKESEISQIETQNERKLVDILALKYASEKIDSHTVNTPPESQIVISSVLYLLMLLANISLFSHLPGTQ